MFNLCSGEGARDEEGVEIGGGMVVGGSGDPGFEEQQPILRREEV